jgi:uncharacterized protein (TIGR02145 family)
MRVTRGFFFLSVLCLLFAVPAYAAASLSLTGGSWDIGTVGAEATDSTTGDTWTITNDSGGSEDFEIKVETTTGTWTARTTDDNNNTTDEYILREDSSDTANLLITGTNKTLAEGVGIDETYGLDLWFKAPPDGSAEEDETLTVTLTATNWEFVCGGDVTFTYKGAEVTYGSVEGQGGTCWLDRNLGASQVATAYNDSAAYGDLFQWGRLDDLHQNRDSGTTSTLSSSDDPGHSNFIKAPDSPYDWRDPQNNNLWQGVSGTNNPCPDGWRIPTETEWDAERASWSEQNYTGAFASSLKLTAAGYRSSSYAGLGDVGSRGYYWSSSVDGTLARRLYFYSSDAYFGSNHRAYGFSVRCILD